MLKKHDLGITPYIENISSRDQSLVRMGTSRVYVIFKFAYMGKFRWPYRSVPILLLLVPHLDQPTLFYSLNKVNRLRTRLHKQCSSGWGLFRPSLLSWTGWGRLRLRHSLLGLEISWILSFKVSTPYIEIPVTYNTCIAYIKANLIDLSDLVLDWPSKDGCVLHCRPN